MSYYTIKQILIHKKPATHDITRDLKSSIAVKKNRWRMVDTPFNNSKEITNSLPVT